MVNKEAKAAVLQRLTGMNGSLRLIFADSGFKCVCTNGWVIFLFLFCLCVCVFNSMQPEHATRATRAGLDVSRSDIVSACRSPGASC